MCVYSRLIAYAERFTRILPIVLIIMYLCLCTIAWTYCDDVWCILCALSTAWSDCDLLKMSFGNVFLTCRCMMSHTTFRMLMHPLHAVIFLLFDILPLSANPRLIFWSLENLPRLNAQWCFLLSAQLLHTYLLRQALKTRVSSRPRLPKVHLKDTSQGFEMSPPLTNISSSVMFSFGCTAPKPLRKG